MNDKRNLVIGIAIVAVLVLGITFPRGNTVVERVVESLGASSGPDHYNLQSFYDGVVNGTQVATSSEGSPTVLAGEFRSWVKSSVVSYSPGLVAGGTITLPASSTITDIVPKAGDRQSFCFRNATSTASVPVLFAGGTGTTLMVASSSATALGGKTVYTGKVACFTLIREASTASTFNIDVLMTVFN